MSTFMQHFLTTHFTGFLTPESAINTSPFKSISDRQRPSSAGSIDRGMTDLDIETKELMATEWFGAFVASIQKRNDPNRVWQRLNFSTGML
jgi:hypothetical protein